MKNKEQYWIKTASGWSIKTAFSGDGSMQDLSKISPEELIDPGTESKMEHEDHVNDLMKELKGIITSGELKDTSEDPRAYEIVSELHNNGISADQIVSYIIGSGNSSNKISDEEISGMM
jgi:hypothetical protein